MDGSCRAWECCRNTPGDKREGEGRVEGVAEHGKVVGKLRGRREGRRGRVDGSCQAWECFRNTPRDVREGDKVTWTGVAECGKVGGTLRGTRVSTRSRACRVARVSKSHDCRGLKSVVETKARRSFFSFSSSLSHHPPLPSLSPPHHASRLRLPHTSPSMFGTCSSPPSSFFWQQCAVVL